MSGGAEHGGTGGGRQWRDRGLTMLAAGFVLVLASNLVDIVRAHAAMAASREQIAGAVAASGKAEAQLNALASGTAALAREGNANAAAVIAALRRNGIDVADAGGRAALAAP